MGIKDGFLFGDGLDSDCIRVESNRLIECVDYINKNKNKEVYICDLYYFEDNINFLRKCDVIESININSGLIKKYDGLFYLHNLKELILQDIQCKIDLSSLKSLERLYVDLQGNKIKGVESLKNLKNLAVWHYNPKDKDLSELSVLDSLEELKIVCSTIQSFKGSESMKNLKVLDCSYLSKLNTIDSLEHNSNTLIELWFDSCKKIQNHDYVTCLTNIEKLHFYNCGEISTIEFINNMPSLKEFVFMGTNILDGNLQPCERLEYVAFTNKKHYSHKDKGFRKGIERR